MFLVVITLSSYDNFPDLPVLVWNEEEDLIPQGRQEEDIRSVALGEKIASSEVTFQWCPLGGSPGCPGSSHSWTRCITVLPGVQPA